MLGLDLNIPLEPPPAWPPAAYKHEHDKKFYMMVEKLHQHFSVYGRLPKVGKYKHDQKLGYWVDNIRRKYRKGKMSPAHIAALQAVPLWTWGKARDGSGNGQAQSGIA